MGEYSRADVTAALRAAAAAVSDSDGDGDGDGNGDGDRNRNRHRNRTARHTLTRTWGQWSAVVARGFSIGTACVAFVGFIAWSIARSLGQQSDTLGINVPSVAAGSVLAWSVGLGLVVAFAVGVLFRPRRVESGPSLGVGASQGYGSVWPGLDSVSGSSPARAEVSHD